jgi:Mrp family chromosome partitioning ATPase
LRLIGDNLAIGLNRERVHDSAEAILDARTADVLDDMQRAFRPDIMVYDLPPVLACDDVIGFLPQLDAILLVVSAEDTKPESVSECERMLQETNLLGIVLNKAEDVESMKYGYEYA